MCLKGGLFTASSQVNFYVLNVYVDSMMKTSKSCSKSMFCFGSHNVKKLLVSSCNQEETLTCPAFALLTCLSYTAADDTTESGFTSFFFWSTVLYSPILYILLRGTVQCLHLRLQNITTIRFRVLLIYDNPKCLTTKNEWFHPRNRRCCTTAIS